MFLEIFYFFAFIILIVPVTSYWKEGTDEDNQTKKIIGSMGTIMLLLFFLHWIYLVYKLMKDNKQSLSSPS
jgi:hypothetical protein